MGRILLPWFLGEVGLSAYSRRWHDIWRKKIIFWDPLNRLFGTAYEVRMGAYTAYGRRWHDILQTEYGTTFGTLLEHFGGTFGAFCSRL